MKTANLALFGTSADPPTVGHRAVLDGLTKLYPFVCTWASENPFKQHGAPLNVRAALLGAVVKELSSRHQPGRLQLRQDFSNSKALYSLVQAEKNFPNHQIVMVVGTDLLAQIPNWYAVEQWLPRCQLAVVPRTGWPLKQKEIAILEKLGAKLSHLALQIPESASSSVRRHPNPELVPASLLPQLVEQNLYGFTTADLPSPCGSP
jgi:nicotinate-nucleotide adenylyltransferase